MLQRTKPKKPPAAPAAKPESSLKQAFLGWYGVIGMTLGYVSPIKLPWADGYAKDYWRHALGSLLIVLALITGLVGLALYLLNVNDFKDQIVDYVKTSKQRDLVLDGDIDLTWFPRLGLDTGKLSLSQRNSGRKFASVNNARLYVAWWPLLFKQVRVERIVLDGVHANLVRHKDGSTNFDDLLLPADWMGEVQFEVDKVRVLDSTLNFHDEGSDLALFLHELNLETGRLADATAGQVQASFRLQSVQPPLDLQLRLAGHVLYEHASQRYQVADLEARAQGEAAGVSDLVLELRAALSARPAQQELALDKLSASAKGRLEQRPFEAQLRADSLALAQGRWRGSAVQAGATLQQGPETAQERWGLTLELPLLQSEGPALRAESAQAVLDLARGPATLQGRFSSPVSLDLATRQLQLDAISGSWSGAHPLLAGKLNAQAGGRLLADWRAQEARLDFKGQLDASEFSGRLQLQDFAAPAWTVELAASTLDLDRYLVSDWPQRLQAALAEPDYRALQSLQLKARLRVDELRAARLQASQLAAELRASAGTLSVDPLQARLYGGSLQGSLGLVAGDTPQSMPQFTLQHKLDGVQFEALLADLAPGEARLSGKGSLALDLSAQGRSAAALRQSLSGTASLALARGSIAGLDLGEALLAGKEQLGLEGAVRQDSVRLTESTAFTELKAGIEFAQGQARSSDVLLKAPHYSARGEARYTLDGGELDARLNVSVAPQLKRSSAGELAELAGISLPLQLSGPWATAAVSYQVGEASGGNLARLAKANQARVVAVAAANTAASAPAPAPAPAASAPAAKAPAASAPAMAVPTTAHAGKAAPPKATAAVAGKAAPR